MKDSYGMSYQDPYKTIEPDTLRNDSKTLLQTLKQHQYIINCSLSKLKQTEPSSTSSIFASTSNIEFNYDRNYEYDKIVNGKNSIKYSTDILNKLNNSIREFNDKFKKYDNIENDNSFSTNKIVSSSTSSDSKFLKKFATKSMSSLNFTNDYDEKENENEIKNLFKSKSRESLKDINKKNTIKTVSFSNYLRTFSNSTSSLATNTSPRQRISRSASPYMQFKAPKKSILKKQQSIDELNDVKDNIRKNFQGSTSNLSSTDSLSTNSLLSMNLNRKLNFYEDEVDDNLISLSNYKKNFLLHDYNNNNTNSNNEASDNSFIEYITKKRESFLNHKYNEGSFSDLNKSNEKCNNDSKKNKTNNDDKKVALKKEANKNIINNKFNVRKSMSIDNLQSRSVPNFNSDKIDDKSKKNNMSSTRKQIIEDKKNSTKMKQYKNMANNLKKTKPLLGCDWAMDAIETKLNTTQTKYEKPEEYWRELSSFRNENRDECISNKQVNFDGTLANVYDLDSFNLTQNHTLSNKTDYLSCYNNNLLGEDDDGRNHKCIHSYRLNDRLFPVPVYKDDFGRSACPVCKKPKKEGTYYSPQFCKISIPKSKIGDLEYKIDFNKRKNVNSEDSLSLANNCSPAYQNSADRGSNMFKIQTNKVLGLKTAAGIKHKANELTLNDVKRIATNRDPATSTLYNKAHAMRYDLEDQHLKEIRRLRESISKLV